MLLLGHHALSVIKRYCFFIHLCYLGRFCHTVGHQVIYRKCYKFERVFLTLRRFLLLMSAFSRLSRSQFNVEVIRAPCGSSKHSPSLTVSLNHTSILKLNIQQELYLNVTNVLINYCGKKFTFKINKQPP